jgi:DUF971 family protein
MTAPIDIKANTLAGSLDLTWTRGAVTRLKFVTLRGECPCAGCVDEWTGRRTLDVSTIPPDLRITAMQLVGNYALKIVWSDGHDTGLFSWKKLRELSERTAT